MTTPNLDDLIEIRGLQSNKRRNLPKHVRRERTLTQMRRSNRARWLADKALRALHPEDWAALFEQASAKVSAEFGPLPGDES